MPHTGKRPCRRGIALPTCTLWGVPASRRLRLRRCGVDTGAANANGNCNSRAMATRRGRKPWRAA
eukprot:2669353-Lingulodinium_polyedra.AAC.1